MAPLIGFQIDRVDQERLWLGLLLVMVPQDTLPFENIVLSTVDRRAPSCSLTLPPEARFHEDAHSQP